MLCVLFIAGMVLMKEYGGLLTALNATAKSGHQGIRMMLKSK